MCGRFALTLPTDAMAGLFDAAITSSFEAPRFNIAPTQSIPVIATAAGERHLVDMRWGFIPHWYKSPTDGPLLINARSETIATKPSFAKAVQTRRCLIPATGFYEWHREKGKGKEPWFVAPAHDDLMVFAGIWQAWTAPEGARHVTCAIVTTEASAQIAEIHHREPVTIAPEDFGLWLGEEGKGAATLMRGADAGAFHAHRVSTAVNGARHDAAELMAPLSEGAE